MRVAMRFEALKLMRSPVGVIATAAITAGILLLVTGMMAALASGSDDLTAKLGPGATLDWRGLTNTSAQITGAGGLIGFGVVLAWLFAREFTDGTITGLFALPVGRGTLATAKLAVYALWATCVSAVVSAALFVVGLAFGFGPPSGDDAAALWRQFALGLLTAAIALPVAWVATAARSLLGGVGAAIGLVIVAQVGTIAGAGGWMPLAAPAIWAISAGTAVSATQLALPVLLAAVIGVITIASWRRLQLDR